MITAPPESSTTHHLTKLYILSLSVVAGLSIAGQALIQHQLIQQQQNMELVEMVSEHQIMNQKLSKLALAVQIAANRPNRQKRLAELRHLTETWEAPSKSLRARMLVAVSTKNGAHLDQMFTTIAPHFDTLLDAAKAILADQAVDSDLSPTFQPSLKQGRNIGRILAAEYAFNQDINRIKQEYSAVIKQGIAELRRLELTLLAITCAVLLVEGILVFRPAVRTLQQTLKKLTVEQEKSERLLLNILPAAIANRLKQDSRAIADGFSEATVLFADIVGFTELSSHLPPQELVGLLNQIFSRFDTLAEKHGLEKIKTIGDAYMVVGGLPNPRTDHAAAVAAMALDMQSAIRTMNAEFSHPLNIRIGINSGPVIAGVIGIKKFIYDLWGDTVNIASRMESHGQAGEIQVSEATYQALQSTPNVTYEFVDRGLIAVKGKGDMRTYWLKNRQLASSNPPHRKQTTQQTNRAAKP